MTGELDSLLQAIGDARRPPPSDLIAALTTLPAAGLPSPWETWALIGLARHRRRRLRVGEVISTRLGGNLHHPAGRMAPLPGRLR
jgi:hypothetical protein